eukprot:TRINITY_DN1746_c3_g2_i2.p1 TRINITY_DN1746_c3_g2~~TRINITY_DN1746_c3_g2_i2.p1  ORF type:complete len:373 (-),score=85.76 TRINITY_DN1746_c3_g2_i2:624-1742(-)
MEAQKINSKTEKSDPKVRKTIEQSNSIKTCDATLNEITKATFRYADLMLKVCDAAKILSDLLLTLADQHGGDIGDGIREIGDILKQLEAKRSKQSQAFMDYLVDPYSKGEQRMESSKKEVDNFDRKYKASRASSLKNLKKGEDTCARLAKRKKRDQNQLDNAIQSLSRTVSEHDAMLADHLREIIRMDRKRFCHYIQQWNEVLLQHTDMFEAGSALIGERLGTLQQLANETQDHIPEAAERLIQDSKPEQALSQLKKARETGYFVSGIDFGDMDPTGTLARSNGPPSPRGLEDEGEYYDDGDDPLGGHPVQPYKVRVKQRYDAQNSDEISLTLGEIFDVTAEIDENWGIAEMHGHRGMFPLNHCEKMRRAGS